MANLIRSIKRFSKKPTTEITPFTHPDSLRTVDETTEINEIILPPTTVISLRSSGSTKINTKEKKKVKLKEKTTDKLTTKAVVSREKKEPRKKKKKTKKTTGWIHILR